jgi:hypothetical protein
MKTNVPLWSYRTEFFSELEMFQTKFVEKIKTLDNVQQLHVQQPSTYAKLEAASAVLGS